MGGRRVATVLQFQVRSVARGGSATASVLCPEWHEDGRGEGVPGEGQAADEERVLQRKVQGCLAANCVE